MTDEELARLLEVSEDYYLLYLSAAYTGLRLNELVKMIVADVKLDQERPHILVRASTTKNSKQAIVPLHPMLVPEFKKAVKGKSIGDLIFPQYCQPDRRIRRHLKAAGIEQIDAAGRKLDFHSLRYTFATKLARKGISQRLAQELMRHSDPRLTANLYTDVTQLPTFDAVESLPWHSEGCPHIGPHEAVSERPAVSQDVTSCGSIYDAESAEYQHDVLELAQPVTNGQMVGPTGFEPATPSPPAKCATRLRYGPTVNAT